MRLRNDEPSSAALADRRAHDVHSALANAARLIGPNPLRASRELRKYLQHRPDDLNAALLLAQARRAGGDPHGALDQFRKISKKHPLFAVPYIEIALTYRDLGALKDAILSAETATRIDPSVPGGWLLLGELNVLAGDREIVNHPLMENAHRGPVQAARGTANGMRRACRTSRQQQLPDSKSRIDLC